MDINGSKNDSLNMFSNLNTLKYLGQFSKTYLSLRITASECVKTFSAIKVVIFF